MLLLLVGMRRDDGCTRLKADEWCCLRFRFATDTRSTSLARPRPAGVGTTYIAAHYEFVDSWSYHVDNRPDQDLMLVDGPGWTGLNRMQLQPCMQPDGVLWAGQAVGGVILSWLGLYGCGTSLLYQVPVSIHGLSCDVMPLRLWAARGCR